MLLRFGTGSALSSDFTAIRMGDALSSIALHPSLVSYTSPPFLVPTVGRENEGLP